MLALKYRAGRLAADHKFDAPARRGWCRTMKRIEQMASMDEIGQERQRLSERLARLDTERARLGDQLKRI